MEREAKEVILMGPAFRIMPPTTSVLVNKPGGQKLLANENPNVAGVPAERPAKLGLIYEDRDCLRKTMPKLSGPSLNLAIKVMPSTEQPILHGAPNQDLKCKYLGFSDGDAALLESTRRNVARAKVLLAQACKLSKSQVPALQLRATEVLANAASNLALALEPFDRTSALVTRSLLGTPVRACIEDALPETRGYSLMNEGFNLDEPRVPAGQPGGGQWTSGSDDQADREKQRATQAQKLRLLAQHYLEKAAEEDPGIGPQPGADREYQRRYAAAEEARKMAAEMKRRAYILEHGTKDNYRQLILEQYGINNPDLDKIAAYYAEKFHDQVTLNWLKKQRPAAHSQNDDTAFIDGLKMILAGGVLEEAEGSSPGGIAGSASEKGTFEQASEAEKETDENDAVQRVGGSPKNIDPSRASVDDKLQRYTLNPDHPDGRDNARWFKQALGYTRENAGGLAKQLVFDESKAVKTAVTPYGTKFNQTINVIGANGRTIPVKTAWIRGSDGVARLVTAVPGD